MRLSRCLVACLALAAVVAPPASGAPSARAPTVALVIWGGGAKPEDADAAAAEIEASGLSTSQPATKLFSSDVKGLKPGYHIAVLGACPPEKASAVMEVVRFYNPGAYSRPVPLEGAIVELSCPEVAITMSPLPEESSEETEEGEFDAPVVKHRRKAVRAGKYTLRVKLTTRFDSNGEFEASSWAAVIELSRGKSVVATEELSRPDFAEVNGFEASADGVTLDTSDMSSDCKGSDYWEGAKVHRLFTIGKGGKIVFDTEERPEFGLCEPSPEGADPAMVRCMSRRYEVLKRSCGGPETREKCLAAIDRYDAKHRRCY